MPGTTETSHTSATPSVARTAAEAGRHTGSVDALLRDSMRALESLIAWDVAALLELEDGELSLREVKGAFPAEEVRARRVALEDAVECREVHEKGFPLTFVREPGELVDPVLGLPRGRHALLAPLCGSRGNQGFLLLERSEDRPWSTGVVELLDVFGRLLGAALEADRDSARSSLAAERAEARTRMVEAKADPIERLEAQCSAAVSFVRESARRMAAGSAPVLITGEEGTGKEVLARAIHAWSPRAAGPFVVFGCGSMPAARHAELLAGEVAGSLTLAEEGSLYLDDVERLSEEAQRVLAAHLRDGRGARILAGSVLGPEGLRALDDTLALALAASGLGLPPLRSRPEDIAPIARGYLRELSAGTGDGPFVLAPRALLWLERQEWPGNVRELVNVLDRAADAERRPGDRLRERPDARRPAASARRRGDLQPARGGEAPHRARAPRDRWSDLRAPGRRGAARDQPEHAAQPHEEARTGRRALVPARDSTSGSLTRRYCSWCASICWRSPESSG